MLVSSKDVSFKIFCFFMVALLVAMYSTSNTLLNTRNTIVNMIRVKLIGEVIDDEYS